MKPLTIEWIAKAEGDFASMTRERRARRNPNYDGLCFHAQQCAEKYLKARLCESNINPPKTHDLSVLLELTLPFEPAWELLRADIAYLSEFAVSFRYPGDSADKDQAANAYQRCLRFREAVRQDLGLPIADTVKSERGGKATVRRKRKMP